MSKLCVRAPTVPPARAALLDEAWRPLPPSARHHRSAPRLHARAAAALAARGLERRARARDAGADVRAVTAWAALGAHDWSSLVTRLDGDYEPGLFDIRAPTPRATALARCWHRRSRRAAPARPSRARGPGWWEQPTRLAVPRAERPRRSRSAGATAIRRTAADRPLLIAGASGHAGQRVRARCAQMRGLEHRGTRSPTRSTSPTAQRVAHVLARPDAWAVVNAAGFVRVDDAEPNGDDCHRANVTVPATLAAACAESGVPLRPSRPISCSTARSGRPYVESDRVAPLERVRRAARRKRSAACSRWLPHALVVRTACVLRAVGRVRTFSRAHFAPSRRGARSIVADDLVVSPTYRAAISSTRRSIC